MAMTWDDVVDRVVGVADYASEEDSVAAFDPTTIITIITTLLALCKRDPAQMKKAANRGGLFVRAQIANAVDKCCPNLKHRQRRLQVLAILRAAQDATEDELQDVCELQAS